ncbi:MAG: hypothetical protein KAH21_02620, partial [Spirochaetaceae bacterium]|nr:hypothetical protein [Spirochaetaceae bacterium]
MKYEALSMPGTSMISSPESSEIMDFLTLITPEKHQWWGRAVQNQLAVDFRPVINLQGFGGLNDTDLAGDIDVCLSAVKEQFDLEKVIVSGIKGYRGAYTGSFNRHSFNGIVLNPSEAGRLYKAVSGDSFDDVRYVYVLSGSEKITSVFRVRAPGNSKVKDIILFIGGKEQYIFNPLTCREIDSEEMIGPDTSLIAVSDKERCLDSFGAGV